MIKLLKLTETQYSVVEDNHTPTWCFSLKEAENCLGRLGVSKEEFYVAIDEMLKNGHDVADFGINRLFNFSTNWRPASLKYAN